MKKQLEPVAAWAILLSATALAVSLGVARWSWLLLDEQIALRKDFVDLREEQTQSNIQYEYWLGKLKEERVQWQMMNEQPSQSPSMMPKK